MTFLRQNRPIPQFDNHERFLSKISINFLSGCWEWNAGKIPSGYGLFMVPFNTRTKNSRFMPSRNFSAHRVSWDIFKGAPDLHLVLDHTCRNKKCVNPEHLREVDEATNGRENSVSVFAINYNKTHCIHGHAFSPENTIQQKKGRKCRECKKRIMAKRYKNKIIARLF